MNIKISKNWLEDFIRIPYSDDELAERLSLSGTLVEKIENPFNNIVVSKIKKISLHPNADKLSVVSVFDGHKERVIVCGAKNIEVGQIVPLALPGAIICGNEIKETEIRGVNSSGMLCSAYELGISNDQSGILILDDSTKIGEKLSKYLDADTIFDLEITPNRGDCLSHLGVAREISALLKTNLSRKPINLKMTGKKIQSILDLEVKDAALCPTYVARALENVKISDSPEWLKKRLISCGIEPINNVVDVTNYILLDLGQPMHAFDLEKIKGKRIIVRCAKKSEKIRSFDGTNLRLEKNDLIIADGEKPIAIAGIVGGIDSGISESTTSIVLEAASFSPKSVRATSKRLGIKTDASMRFERGVDPNLALYAIDKAAKMISEISGAIIFSGVLKHKVDSSETKIRFEYDKINNLLGTKISESEMIEILKRLNFKIEKNFVIVPSFRPDVTIWQDLAEEIIRLHGINNLKSLAVEKTKTTNNTEYFYKEIIKDIFVEFGFSESYNYSFISDNDCEIFNIDKKNLVKVANPLVPENHFMRNSLLFGLLKNIAKNPSFNNIMIFEIGKVFNKAGEKFYLGAIVSGKDATENLKKTVAQLENQFSFEKKIIEINSSDLLKYKIKRNSISYLEIDLSLVAKSFVGNANSLKIKKANFDIVYRDISKFPSVVRDLAFIVSEKIKSEDVESEIKKNSKYVIISEPFDEFKSDKFGVGKKNLAYHIHLQAEDRTLKDTEAETEIRNIIKNIEKMFNAKLRNY
ncbi:MAG: phenylalanyl-tRNA synthetase beta chain [Candidatus Berkelbacteria bacterium Athens1014_28]|uniref:Phenylalanine--tRNA ligase beta subunit n=1 Tax=Candidatus Berkelbacteria bacterium Athens1014_28 TaxID=2017145 RepID=A0A554LR59_9BACT|nr:MAG: phenylalanyl-tRNA synthetase beta chain [Candidatus Berkelbacteria bacterium Athens1014_28]